MSLKAKVKVGRVTNLSEARYCAGMGVDLLGFPVGPDGLKPEQYKQLIEWVAGPEFVLEAHRSQTLDLTYITDNYPGHYIEIGIHQLEWLSHKDLNFIVAIEPQEWVRFSGKLKGENLKFIEVINWGHEKIESVVPVLVNINSIDDIAKTDHGIALTGSDEEKPGIKDYSSIADILEALEAE